MKSIKRKLVSSFVLVIFISILIIEFLLITFIRHYYYKNTENVLTNQIKMSADFYNRYFSNSTLQDNILDNVDVFWKQTSAQVQIIDTDGNVLMDSIGVIHKSKLTTADFLKAVEDQKGTWIGNVNYEDSNVMAVSYPLKSNNKIVGVLRFITSLDDVDNGIKSISFAFLSIGIIAILISGIISLFLSRSIVGPVKELTATAEKLASGNFKVRSCKKNDDEIGKLSDTLNYMAEEILEKDELKNHFISSVSHELRTPLTSIKGWAVILNTVNDKETLSEGLGIIEKETDRLTSMVEELLDFSRFVSGKVDLKKEDIYIEDLVLYLKKYMSPRAKRDNLKFIVHCEENIPSISIDVNRIKQVLINVIDNAFKFTEVNGEILFSTKVVNNYLIMSIKDNGCGISPEDLPKVKEKFYKGKNSNSHNGIGLSICDEIIKMHEGFLIINSILNKGTEVIIKLPFKNN